MSAERAAERLCGGIENAFSVEFANRKKVVTLIAQIIREETRCDRLAEALALIKRGQELANFIIALADKKDSHHVCLIENAPHAYEFVAQARALLAEMGAEGEKGGNL